MQILTKPQHFLDNYWRKWVCMGEISSL